MYYSELFGDASPQGGGYNPRPHPRTTLRGTFSLIPVPTGENSPTVDPQTGQSLRGSTFKDQINIPTPNWQARG